MTANVKSFKPFIILWLTQGLSILGNSITYFSIVFWLTTHIYTGKENDSKLTIILTLLSLATIIPGMVISPFLGVLVDRLDKKKIMVLMDILLGFMALILFLLFLLNKEQVWLMILILSAMSLFSTFHSITLSSSYILIVPKKHLTRANSMMSTMYTVSALVAPTITATFISFSNVLNNFSFFSSSSHTSGIVLALFIDFVTFFISAITIFFLKLPLPKINRDSKVLQKNGAFLKEIKEGAQYLFKQASFVWLLMVGVIVSFVNCIDSLIPIMVKSNLVNSWEALNWNYQYSYAFIETIGFLGAVIGGVLLVSLPFFGKRKMWLLITSLIICGVSIVWFGITKLILVAAGLLIIKSFMLCIYSTYDATIWQSSIPAEMQGRVFGVKRFFNQLSVMLGFIVVGAMGSIFNVTLVHVILGILLVVISGLLIMNKSFMKFRIHSNRNHKILK